MNSKKDNPVILVVEDDQYNYDLLEVILAEIKATVLWAKNASQGIELFQKEAIDLVLMDIKLPDRSGYELTRDMKALKNEVPIIAQTAYALTGDREKSLEAGCDEYMPKPIRKAKLMEIVKRLLEKNGAI